MAPSSQELEPPANPGRFSTLLVTSTPVRIGIENPSAVQLAGFPFQCDATSAAMLNATTHSAANDHKAIAICLGTASGR